MDENDALRRRVSDLEAELGQLRKRELHLARTLEIARTGSWELDMTAGVAEWSPATRAILGGGPDAPATPGTVLSRVHPDDREIVPDALQAVAAGAQRYDGTYRAKAQDGGYRTIHSLGDVQRGSDGRTRNSRMASSEDDAGALVLDKPFTPDQLLERVSSALGSGRE